MNNMSKKAGGTAGGAPQTKSEKAGGAAGGAPQTKPH